MVIPLSKKLFLIDNSPTDILKNKFNHQDIDYRFNAKNIGFGAGHNTVIDTIKKTSEYHLILNPDVSFAPDVIPTLIEELEADKELAMIVPKVVFPNGKRQYSCRRYPSFSELLFRWLGLEFQRVKKGEYRDKDLTQPFYPDFLQGCFLLFKTTDFVELGGFDERYFLYMEDVDICKKIDALGKKKMYYPYNEIVHNLKKGSSKNIKLFFHHFSSIIKYFKKWKIQ
jgi:GT2 family glycosyltransferase